MTHRRTDDLAERIRIGADEKAANEALRKIAANYAAHGWPSYAPSYGFEMAPQGGESGRSLDTDFLLYQLAHMDMTLTLSQNPSSVPIFGPLIDALKRPLHQLVLFYVNRIAAQSATASLLQAALIQQIRHEMSETYCLDEREPS